MTEPKEQAPPSEDELKEMRRVAFEAARASERSDVTNLASYVDWLVAEVKRLRADATALARRAERWRDRYVTLCGDIGRRPDVDEPEPLAPPGPSGRTEARAAVGESSLPKSPTAEELTEFAPEPPEDPGPPDMCGLQPGQNLRNPKHHPCALSPGHGGPHKRPVVVYVPLGPEEGIAPQALPAEEIGELPAPAVVERRDFVGVAQYAAAFGQYLSSSAATRDVDSDEEDWLGGLEGKRVRLTVEVLGDVDGAKEKS